MSKYTTVRKAYADGERAARVGRINLGEETVTYLQGQSFEVGTELAFIHKDGPVSEVMGDRIHNTTLVRHFWAGYIAAKFVKPSVKLPAR